MWAHNKRNLHPRWEGSGGEGFEHYSWHWSWDSLKLGFMRQKIGFILSFLKITSLSRVSFPSMLAWESLKFHVLKYNRWLSGVQRMWRPDTPHGESPGTQTVLYVEGRGPGFDAAMLMLGSPPAAYSPVWPGTSNWVSLSPNTSVCKRDGEDQMRLEAICI